MFAVPSVHDALKMFLLLACGYLPGPDPLVKEGMETEMKLYVFSRVQLEEVKERAVTQAQKWGVLEVFEEILCKSDLVLMSD